MNFFSAWMDLGGVILFHIFNPEYSIGNYSQISHILRRRSIYLKCLVLFNRVSSIIENVFVSGVMTIGWTLLVVIWITSNLILLWYGVILKVVQVYNSYPSPTAWKHKFNNPVFSYNLIFL